MVLTTVAEIERFQLSPYARECAIKLCAAFPDVVITSGRRDIEDQAHAMARNVIRAMQEKKGNWIRNTYLHPGPLAIYVDQYPNASQKEFEDNFNLIMTNMSDQDLMDVSHHLTGDAFDIQPMLDGDGLVTNMGYQVLDFVRRSLRDAKLITVEGGLVVWHIQVPRSVEV